MDDVRCLMSGALVSFTILYLLMFVFSLSLFPALSTLCLLTILLFITFLLIN